MNRITILIGLLLLPGLTMSTWAAVLEDFQFSDTNGTLLANAANGVNPLNLWNEDTADMDNSAVLDGVYRIQKSTAISPPNGFGTNFLDIANVSSGRVWLVAEIAGWFFASGTADPADFDPNELEEIRFDFLNNDGNSQGGSTVTAEAEIQRTTDGGLEILGTALGSGTDVGSQPLPLSQTEPFTLVLGLNKTANTYSIYTQSGGGPFSLLGSGDVDPTRDGNSVRFIANNSFAGMGEFFDISRIYLTDTNPVPEPQAWSLLALAALMAGAWRRRK